MNSKTIITVLLLVFVVLSAGYLVYKETSAPADEPTATAVAETSDNEAQVTVYYFHGNRRCETCLKLEDYAAKALVAGFQQELAAGRVTFESVNYEEEGNEGFVNTYQLVSASVVVVDHRPEQDDQWVNLEKIWELVGDRAAYFEYVQGAVTTYLDEA